MSAIMRGLSCGRGGVIALSLGLFACPAQAPEPPKESASKPAASQPSSAASAPAELSGKGACFPKFDGGGEAKTGALAGVAFERTGTVMTMKADEDDTTRLGVLGNIKEYSAANEEALGEYLSFFKSKKVDAIVVTGDVGESTEDIEKALRAIAQAGVPVFAIIGNRENRDEFDLALGGLQKAGVPVVNLNHVRLVKLDDHALVSVPGYYNADYVHAPKGCVYDPSDLAEVKKAIEAAGDTPVIVVSHGPPAQKGEEGIDVLLDEKDNVGDPALAALLAETEVPFVLASNIQEAGGKGTNREGTKVVQPKAMVDELYFNPGGADRTVAWKMNDGSFAYGMAGVVTYKGSKAAFEMIRLSEPE